MAGQHTARREPFRAHSGTFELMPETSIRSSSGSSSRDRRVQAAQGLVGGAATLAEDGKQEAVWHERRADAVGLGSEPETNECSHSIQRLQFICGIVLAEVAPQAPSRG